MSFLVVSGVCRPQTFEALELAKGIQRQTNRVLDSTNKKLLFVDGRIGSKTISAVNVALGSSFQNCSDIANNAKSILAQLKNLANSQNLVIVADPESIVRSTFSPPSQFNSETNQVEHPRLSVAGVPILYLALAGFGGYYYFYKTKSGKKTRKSITGGF